MQKIPSICRCVVTFLDFHLLAPKTQPVRRFLWLAFFGVMTTLTVIMGFLTIYNSYSIPKKLKDEVLINRRNFIQQGKESLKRKISTPKNEE